jgi:hypothetical protein
MIEYPIGEIGLSVITASLWIIDHNGQDIDRSILGSHPVEFNCLGLDEVLHRVKLNG